MRRPTPSRGLIIRTSPVRTEVVGPKSDGGRGGGAPTMGPVTNGTMVLSSPSYRVTVGGGARDHSPTRTNVVVWLQTL